MGNWIRVKIEGTCDAADVAALMKALTLEKDFSNFHCLISGGIRGLPNWAAESIEAVGNLAESGYIEEDVADTLEELAEIAPSLHVRVHMGDDNEGSKCVATVRLREGKSYIVDPEIEEIPEIDQEQMLENLKWQLGG